MRTRILAAIALVASSTVMAIYGVAGASRLSGPVLLTLSAGHGIHLDDLLVAACWTVTLIVAGLLLTWRR